MGYILQLLCLALLAIAVQCQSSSPTPLAADQYNTCFSCVMSNYKYCAVQKKCVALATQCNMNETFYLKDIGCPVTQKCDIGVDGNFFLDTGLATKGGLDTSNDGQMRFSNMTFDFVKKNPSKFPCAMVLYNLPKKELTFQISGPNVGVQLLKLNYPNRVARESLNPFNPTSTFTMMPENDMTIVYLGSTASV